MGKGGAAAAPGAPPGPPHDELRLDAMRQPDISVTNTVIARAQLWFNVDDEEEIRNNNDAIEENNDKHSMIKQV